MNADLFLIVYSCLKAFLPLPSLEAVLVPFCLADPQKSLYYALISGIGTFLGANFGYELARCYGRDFALRFMSAKTLDQGEVAMKKYGALAIITGSITPFPDFILAYVAGIYKMNRWLFLLLDGGSRFVRSLLVAYSVNQLSEHFAIEKYSTILSILILIYFLLKYTLKKER